MNKLFKLLVRCARFQLYTKFYKLKFCVAEAASIQSNRALDALGCLIWTETHKHPRYVSKYILINRHPAATALVACAHRPAVVAKQARELLTKEASPRDRFFGGRGRLLLVTEKNNCDDINLLSHIQDHQDAQNLRRPRRRCLRCRLQCAHPDGSPALGNSRALTYL